MKRTVGWALAQPFSPKTYAIDLIQADIQAMLPRMVWWSILGQRTVAIRRDDGMDEWTGISRRVLHHYRRWVFATTNRNTSWRMFNDQ